MSTSPSAAGPNSSTVARLAVRGTVWVTLTQYLTLLIGFAANLVLTRLLRPEMFGFFALSTFWIGVLGLRAKAGLNYAAIRQPALTGALLGTYTMLEVGLALLGVVISAVAGALLVNVFNYAASVGYVLVALAIGDVVMSLSAPFAVATEREMLLGRPSLIVFFASGLNYVLVIGLAWAGAGVYSLAAINILNYSFVLIGLAWFCRRHLPQIFRLRWTWDKNLARALFQQGLPTGLSLTAVTSVSNQYDNFMVGTFIGAQTLGFYDRAFRMGHWSNIVLTTVVGRVGYLTFAKVKDDLPRLTHAVRLGLWVLTTLGIPFTLILLFGARDVVSLLYGAAWSASADYLPYIAITALMLPVQNLAFWLATALGKQRIAGGLLVIHAIAVVVLVTPLTLGWGMAGTLLGVMGAALLSSALSYAYIFRQLPLTWRETLSIPILSTIVTTLVLFSLTLIPSWGVLTSWARLPITITLVPILYFAVTWLLAPNDTRNRLRYVMSAWRPAQS